MRAAEVFPSPEAYQQFGQAAGPLLGNGMPFETPEYQFKKRDGTLFWCRVRAPRRSTPTAAKRARSGSSKT
ncbi:hypothetical protein LP420_07725 [Massilia sp. B-10]|nr:hypothetical protein LP420_07725 [Massilia sp. B-10]